MVDLRKMSSPILLPSSAEKIPRQIPVMHTVRGDLRALSAILGIFRGVGIWGKGPNPCSGISLFSRQGCGSSHTCRIPHENLNAGMWAGMSSGVTGA